MVARLRGVRPYLCDHPCCNKTFTRNEELTRHRRIHTGLRPFSCPVCNKSFGRRDHLKKHTRTHEKNGISLSNLDLSSGSEPPVISEHSSASSAQTPTEQSQPSSQEQQSQIKQAIKEEARKSSLLPPSAQEQCHPFAEHPSMLMASAAAFANPHPSLPMAHQNYPMQHALEWPSPQAPGALFDFASSEALAMAAAANQHLASIASMNNTLAMQQYVQQHQQYQLTQQQLDLIYRLGAVAINQQSLIHPQTSAPAFAEYWQNTHTEGSTADSHRLHAQL